MNFSEVLELVINGGELDYETAREMMGLIMTGGLNESQISGFLVALRARGETPEEIAGFASSMRTHARSLEVGPENRPLVDTCGTGGDAAETFNISTTSALVAAAAGARVAKHGNRSVSSSCGSADILEALGVAIELPPSAVEHCITEVGIGFMFAPVFHRAMKHAIGPRKSLGIRTVFNLLGPLTNPAGADRQLLGVFAEKWVKPLAQALKRLGVEQALVVHGLDGMDEITLCSPTRYCRLDSGEITEGEFTAEEFGLKPVKPEEIAGGGLDENCRIIEDLLHNRASEAVESIVCVNAGAVLMLADLVDSIEQGIKLARETIRSGKTLDKLQELVDCSRELAS